MNVYINLVVVLAVGRVARIDCNIAAPGIDRPTHCQAREARCRVFPFLPIRLRLPRDSLLSVMLFSFILTQVRR